MPGRSLLSDNVDEVPLDDSVISGEDGGADNSDRDEDYEEEEDDDARVMDNEVDQVNRQLDLDHGAESPERCLSCKQVNPSIPASPSLVKEFWPSASRSLSPRSYGSTSISYNASISRCRALSGSTSCHESNSTGCLTLDDNLSSSIAMDCQSMHSDPAILWHAADPPPANEYASSRSSQSSYSSANEGYWSSCSSSMDGYITSRRASNMFTSTLANITEEVVEFNSELSVAQADSVGHGHGQGQEVTTVERISSDSLPSASAEGEDVQQQVIPLTETNAVMEGETIFDKIIRGHRSREMASSIPDKQENSDVICNKSSVFAFDRLEST